MSTHRIIIAVSDNGVIGVNGQIPWHLVNDLKNFKQLTMGTHVVMGRATYDSLPPNGLPGRTLHIISKTSRQNTPGVCWYTSYEATELALSAQPGYVSWIGGVSCVKYALTVASEVHYTRVHAVVDGDTYVDLEPGKHGFTLVSQNKQCEHGLPYTIESWIK